MANVFRRQMTYNVIILALMTILIILWSRYILVSVSEAKLENSLTTNKGRVSLLLGYGWRVDEILVEEETFTIPEQFDEVYENYSKQQKSWGFDISPFRGKQVTRYTYRVLDYPFSDDPDVYANLIICGERLVCAEIYTRALDGFMHAIDRRSLPKDYMRDRNP